MGDQTPRLKAIVDWHDTGAVSARVFGKRIVYVARDGVETDISDAVIGDVKLVIDSKHGTVIELMAVGDIERDRG